MSPSKIRDSVKSGKTRIAVIGLGQVGFTPGNAGKHQKVEFTLYKNGKSEAYLTLYLWLDVSQ